MKEIRDLKVTQIRIFPIDELPFESLLRPSAIKQIASIFNFNTPPVFPEGFPVEIPSILFRNGEFTYENQTTLIEQASIERRRLITSLAGNSTVSDAFFVELKDNFAKLDLRNINRNYEPIITTEETQCIVQLDFPITDLFKNSPIGKFAPLLRKKSLCHECDITAIPFSIKFRISYLNIPDVIKQHRITLTDKDFIIEQREKTSIEENLYWTSSPTPSDGHLELIKEFEKLVMQ